MTPIINAYPPRTAPRRYSIAPLTPLLFLLLSTLLLPAPAVACPMCSESQSNSLGPQTLDAAPPPRPDAASPMTVPEKPMLAQGVYYSILFMLTMIYGVPIALGAMLYRAYKKHAPHNRQAPLQPAPPAQTSSPTTAT